MPLTDLIWISHKHDKENNDLRVRWVRIGQQFVGIEYWIQQSNIIMEWNINVLT